MDDLSSLIKGIVSQLGQAFFLSGFLPVLIGVAVNQYVIFGPEFGGAEAVWNLFPEVTEPFLGLITAEWLTTISVSLVLALVLLPLNMLVITVFEGRPAIMKALLFPLYSRQLRRHGKYYAEIGGKRGERRDLLAEFEETGKYDKEADFALQDELDRLHRAVERKEPVQVLPYERRRVKPTMFGNAWAVMEEYPLDRYGIDSMVFWPYVRAVVGKENGDLLMQIDTQKLLIDITVHLALVMAVLVVEGLVLAALRMQLAMLLLAVVCLGLFAAFYQAGVTYSRAMSTLVTQCFDLYRLQVLDALGVARPEDLDEEYWVWTRLGAFLRRGEAFYFDMLERAGEEEE
jgi:hypothetical protein